VLAAPLVDVPVVVGLQNAVSVLRVLGCPLGEQLAVELDEGPEAQRRQNAVHVHVVDAGVDIVGGLAQVVEARRLHAPLVLGASNDGIEADVDRDEIVPYPDLVARRVLGDAWLLHTPREVLLEHVRRLDDVVIDAGDDDVFHAHGALPD
jgi:hypothetical protein